MPHVPVLTIGSAPAASQEALEGARRAFGFVPNLLGVLAASPAALHAYLSLSEAFNASAFTDVERQVVLLSVRLHSDPPAATAPTWLAVRFVKTRDAAVLGLTP